MSDIKPLTHTDKRFAHGYAITALRDKRGDYHVKVYDSVYKLKHDLQTEPTKSELSVDEFNKINDALLDDDGAYTYVSCEELESVHVAFDHLAFGDEDPIYKDEVYLHLSDLGDFVNFCEECKRRRAQKGGIGIGTCDVAFCGKKAIECAAWTRQMCMTLWAVRHAKMIQNMVKPEFYTVEEYE